MPNRLLSLAGVDALLSGIAGIVAFLAPVQVIAGAPAQEMSDMVWLWRGLITGPILLNLFFIRTVYKKLQRIGPHTRAISTLHVAVDFLAREASEHGAKRQADHLIFKMLDDVEKLVNLEEVE